MYSLNNQIKTGFNMKKNTNAYYYAFSVQNFRSVVQYKWEDNSCLTYPPLKAKRASNNRALNKKT